MPRPPQTESISTPRLRAACRIGVPSGKRPRLPEGMKTTSASVLEVAPGLMRPSPGCSHAGHPLRRAHVAGSAGGGTGGAAAAAFTAAAAGFLALGGRLAELLDPA